MLATLITVVVIGTFASTPGWSADMPEPDPVFDQRVSQTLASGDIEAHRTLLRETDISATDSVRLHLLTLLKNELAKRPKGSARDAIIAEIDHFSRDIYLDVTARSWRNDPQEYREMMAMGYFHSQIPGRTLRLVDSPDAAQITVRLVVAEKKGKAYFKNFISRDSEPAGFSTNIDASLEIRNLVSGRTYVTRKIEYRTPEYLSMTESTSDLVEQMAEDAAKTLLDHYYLKNISSALLVFLGDHPPCSTYYDDWIVDENNRSLAAELLQKSGCTAQTPKERVVWSLVTNNQDACLKEGAACVEVLRDLLDPWYKNSRFFPWLKASGNLGDTYLCDMLKNLGGDSGMTSFNEYRWTSEKGVDRFGTRQIKVTVGFDEYLAAVAAINNQEALTCLKAVAELPTPVGGEEFFGKQTAVDDEFRRIAHQNDEALARKRRSALLKEIERLEKK